MPNWARSIFCILSLLILVASIAVWIRSYFVAADLERFSRETDATRQPVLTRTLAYGIACGPGRFGIFCYGGESHEPKQLARAWIYREFPPARKLNLARSPDDRVNVRLGSFQFVHQVQTSADGWIGERIVIVPFWIFLLAAIPPIAWWRRFRKRGTAVCPEVTTDDHG